METEVGAGRMGTEWEQVGWEQVGRGTEVGGGRMGTEVGAGRMGE